MVRIQQSEIVENRYVYVAMLEVEYVYSCTGKNRVPKTYSMKAGELGFKFAKKCFKKIIEEIDDSDFIELRIVGSEKTPYGDQNKHSRKIGLKETYTFYILKDDIDKLLNSEEIHIVCFAEEYPRERTEFIEILKILLNK